VNSGGRKRHHRKKSGCRTKKKRRGGRLRKGKNGHSKEKQRPADIKDVGKRRQAKGEEKIRLKGEKPQIKEGKKGSKPSGRPQGTAQEAGFGDEAPTPSERKTGP